MRPSLGGCQWGVEMGEDGGGGVLGGQRAESAAGFVGDAAFGAGGGDDGVGGVVHFGVLGFWDLLVGMAVDDVVSKGDSNSSARYGFTVDLELLRVAIYAYLRSISSREHSKAKRRESISHSKNRDG